MKEIPITSRGESFEQRIYENLAEFGVTKILGEADVRTLDLLRCEFDEILSADIPGVRDLGISVGRGRDLVMKELDENAFPTTRSFFSREWMQNLSDLYWGEKRVLNDHVFVTNEIPGTEHLAQSLHFDVQETLKFFLYLNDVTSENGAFSCVPGSVSYTSERRKELGDEVSYDNRGPSRDHPFSEEEIIPVEAKAGTLIVFTTEVWHRAGLVENGERRVMRGHTRTKIEKSGSTKGNEIRSAVKPGLVGRIKSFLRRA